MRSTAPWATADDFEVWWGRFGKPYETAVLENGGTPWTIDADERRALWEQRYQRPEPPAGLYTDPRAIPEHNTKAAA